MKTTVVSWRFDHLFNNALCVSARINAKESNPRLKRDFLSRIEMTPVTPSRYVPFRDRVLVITVMWHHDKTKRGGSWAYTLFETLKAAGAVEKGCIKRDSFQVYWRLKKGERFTDGAIRIAKMLFQMLEIKIEKNEFISDQDLISMFVVYERIFIGKLGVRFEKYLQKRHGLPENRSLLIL